MLHTFPIKNPYKYNTLSQLCQTTNKETLFIEGVKWNEQINQFVLLTKPVSHTGKKQNPSDYSIIKSGPLVIQCPYRKFIKSHLI